MEEINWGYTIGVFCMGWGIGMICGCLYCWPKGM